MFTKQSIIRITNRLYDSNTYIIEYTKNLAFVVDPGSDWDKIETALVNNKLTPTHVFCTHGHFDHVGSVTQLCETYNSLSVLHRDDIRIAKSVNFLMMAFGLKERVKTPIIRTFAEDGDSFFLNNHKLSFIHVPGHSKGSCFLSFENLLFTGDSLYAKGIGLPSPDENLERLRSSVLKYWNSIHHDTIICPGHGELAFFGDIIKNNKELLIFLQLGENNNE